MLLFAGRSMLLHCLLLSRLSSTSTSALLICVLLSWLRCIVLMMVVCLVRTCTLLFRFTRFSLDHGFLFGLRFRCCLGLTLGVRLARFLLMLLLLRLWLLLFLLFLSDYQLRLLQGFQYLPFLRSQPLQLLSLSIQRPLVHDLLQELLILIQKHILDYFASWWKRLNRKCHLLLGGLPAVFLLHSHHLICTVHWLVSTAVKYLYRICLNLGQPMDFLFVIRVQTVLIRTYRHSLALLYAFGRFESSTTANWELVFAFPFLEVNLCLWFESVYQEVIHNSLQLGKLLLGEVFRSLNWILILTQIRRVLVIFRVIAALAGIRVLWARPLRHGITPWGIITGSRRLAIRFVCVGVLLTILRLNDLLLVPAPLSSCTLLPVGRARPFRVPRRRDLTSTTG